MRDWKPHLQTKGWISSEAEKAVRIIKESVQHKTPALRLIDATAYWFALALAILGNFIVSIVLVPFFLVMTGPTLYISVIFIGLSFGSLLDILVKHLEKVETHHHVIAEVFIPTLALTNVYLVAVMTNRLSLAMNLPTTHIPWALGLIYTLAFALPHLVRRYKNYAKRKMRAIIDTT